MATVPRPPTEPEVERYRPVSGRGRLLIALLAVATAAFVTWSMTRKSGIVPATLREAARHASDVPACASGQREGCTGGLTVVLPAAPAASR